MTENTIKPGYTTKAFAALALLAHGKSMDEAVAFSGLSAETIGKLARGENVDIDEAGGPEHE